MRIPRDGSNENVNTVGLLVNLSQVGNRIVKICGICVYSCFNNLICNNQEDLRFEILLSNVISVILIILPILS